MLRSETQPQNGARITRSPIAARASAACALAWPASATCASTALSVAKPRDLATPRADRAAASPRGRGPAPRQAGHSPVAVASTAIDLPAPHIGAVVEIESHDPLSHRRGQRHLFVGARGADRIDPLDEAFGLHRRHGHQRSLARFLLRGIAAATSCQHRRGGEEGENGSHEVQCAMDTREGRQACPTNLSQKCVNTLRRSIGTLRRHPQPSASHHCNISRNGASRAARQETRHSPDRRLAVSHRRDRHRRARARPAGHVARHRALGDPQGQCRYRLPPRTPPPRGRRRRRPGSRARSAPPRSARIAIARRAATARR